MPLIGTRRRGRVRKEDTGVGMDKNYCAACWTRVLWETAERRHQEHPELRTEAEGTRVSSRRGWSYSKDGRLRGGDLTPLKRLLAELRREGGGAGSIARDYGSCQSRRNDQRQFPLHGEHRALHTAASTPLRCILCSLFSSKESQAIAMLLLHLLPHLQTQALPKPVLFRDPSYLSFLDLRAPQSLPAALGVRHVAMTTRQAHHLPGLGRAQEVWLNQSDQNESSLGIQSLECL